jgi:hypothetical protein
MASEVVASDTDPAKRVSGLGVVVGSALGGLYAIWALLVASGLAQALFDAVAVRLHARPVYVIEQVDPLRAAALALLAAAIGYATGAACAAAHRSRARGHSLSID